MSPTHQSSVAASKEERLRDNNASISTLEAACLSQSGDAANRAESLRQLGSLWSTRYDLTSDLDDLEAAIRFTKGAVSSSSEGDTNLPSRLIQVGEFLSKRHHRTKSFSDLQEAVSHVEKALPLVPENDYNRAKGTGILGVMLSSRFGQTGQISDLNAAIQNTGISLTFVPKDAPHRVYGQGIMINLLSLRWERTRNLDDLDAAIDYLEQSVSSTPQGHPVFPRRLYNLGGLLFSRYEQKGDLNDLEVAIQNETRAIAAMPGDYPGLSVWLGDLGKCHSRRYEHTGDAKDFDLATARIKQALSMMPEGDPNYGIALDYLGHLFIGRYERTGDVNDLESAIQVSAQVASTTAKDSARLAVRIGNFGSRTYRRYKRTGCKDDLDAAIEKTKEAALATSNHPDHAAGVNNLGSMLLNRYEHAGDLEDLNDAIVYAKKAVDLTSNNHFSLPGYLMGLGNALAARYTRTGNTDDLNSAIFHLERAESACSVTKDHPEHRKVLYGLGLRLAQRYRRSGEADDITKAIVHVERVVHLMNERDPRYASYLNGFGCMLFSRYGSQRDLEDLERAITITRKVISLVPETDPEYPGYLCNIGSMLEAGYKSKRTLDDLDEAISALRRMREATSIENPDYAEWRSRLGRILSQRIGITVSQQLAAADSSNPEDAREFLDMLQDIRGDIYDSEKPRPSLRTLQDLRKAIHNPGEAGKRPSLTQELLEALEIFEETSQSPSALPRTRVVAARRAVATLSLLQDWDSACQIAQDAVKLLPLVCGRYLNRRDQKHAIEATSGVASTACSLSLKIGRVEQALQQVEFGRGLILGYLIDNNSDLSVLRRDSPSLAKEFEELRSKAIVSISSTDPIIQQQAIEERTEAVQRLQACLESIRLTPGHERFLLEPAIDDLLKGAADGPIIVVNITNISSDAIIVSRAGIRSIELPNMTAEKASFLAEDFGRYSAMVQDDDYFDRYIKPEAPPVTKYSPEVLSWLWKNCVKPVLDEISGDLRSSQQPPRVWWIGTGVASSLPFHAAGDYSQGTDEDTLSRVIPSYTPTIKALMHARLCAAKSAADEEVKKSVLVVTMPETHGYKRLPGVTKEAVAIQMAAQDTFTLKHMEKPSVEMVMGEIGQSDILHFACHGSSDRVDPSNSHLLLHRPPLSDPSEGNLTLRQISDSQSAGKAKIAYLSACSTAEVRAGGFADEALHIVSAFQVVGFGHVIGSLWSVDDETSVKVAKLFYESLSGGKGQITNQAIAEALRKAVMEVRSNVEPRVWASYVHFGA